VLLLLLLLIAVVVEELQSQLSAERKRNVQLKQLNESLLNSQEETNIQLAFCKDERGFLGSQY